MSKDLIAKASVVVDTPIEKVWRAFVDPAIIQKYMFGTSAESDWKPGAPIVWKGEWQGQPYEDKGVILKADPPYTLQYTHFSPVTGQPDTPENYHTVTIRLFGQAGKTVVSLWQDKNPTEEARQRSEENWRNMLTALRGVLGG
jgi:uncharacterized protein YndB with AHSA1/START domain